jgi:hypothetical protein
MRPIDVTAPTRLAHLTKDDRGYPILATVSRSRSGVDFGAISERRKLALAAFDWCGVCGLPFGAESRWQVVVTPADDDRPRDQLEFGEAPVHEICAAYAAQVCPYLSSPGARMGDELRKGQVREPTVHVVGFARTVEVRARESGLQRGTLVLHFSHAGRIDSLTYTRPAELGERYRALLAKETTPLTTPAERALIGLFNRVDDDDGGPVTGAAVMAGAAFARDVFRVQGMHSLNREAYRGFAMLLLHEDACRDFAVDCQDEAARAVAGWLLERGEDLPWVLGQWRRIGRRQVRLSTNRQRPAVPDRRRQGRASRRR